MRISLDRTEIDVRPGRTSRVTVELHNTGDLADMVSLSIDVPGSAWVVTAQPVIRVSRAETVFVIAEVHVGRDVAAGVHDAVLWARSAIDPERSVATRLRLTVEPVPSVRLVVSPSAVEARSSVSTTGTVTNTGNTPLSLAISTRDPAGLVRCTVSPSTVSLPVGASAELAVALDVPQRRVGTVTRRLVGIQVTGTSPVGEIATEEFITVRHRPLIARAIARATLIGLVMVVAAIVATVAIGGSRQETKTPAQGFVVGVTDTAPAGSLLGRVVSTLDRRPVVRSSVVALRDVGDGTAVAYGAAATDGDGAFSFDNLPGGTYRLTVTAVGFVEVVSEPVVVVPGTELEIDDIVMSGAAADLVIDLVFDDPDALGSAPGALVDIVTVEDRDATASTTVTVGGDGTAVARFDELPSPSTQRVTITADGHVTRVVDIAVGPGASERPPTVAVTAESASISGRVIDTAAIPLGGITVRATSGPVVVTTTSDSVTGSYVLSGLRAPRTYVVEFSAEGYASQSRAVDVGAGAVLDDVNGSLIGSAGSVSGKVQAADGTPIGSARVTVRGAGSVTTTATLTSVGAGGGPGSYRVAGLAVPGTYTVTVTADGYLPVTESVSFVVASVDTELDVVMTPSTGRVVGTVRADGTALAGATVRLDDGRSTRSAVSASSPAGAFTFTGLAPGSYTLSVTAIGYAEHIMLLDVEAGRDTEATSALAVDVGVGN
jgi:hypothetical protein